MTPPGRPARLQQNRPFRRLCTIAARQRARLRLVHEEKFSPGRHFTSRATFAGEMAMAATGFDLGICARNQTGQRFLWKVGIGDDQVARRDDFAHRLLLQSPWREQPIKLHVGQRNHQITVVFQNGRVAWRLSIKEDERAIDNSGFTRRPGDHLANGIAAARARSCRTSSPSRARLRAALNAPPPASSNQLPGLLDPGTVAPNTCPAYRYARRQRWKLVCLSCVFLCADSRAIRCAAMLICFLFQLFPQIPKSVEQEKNTHPFLLMIQFDRYRLRNENKKCT